VLCTDVGTYEVQHPSSYMTCVGLTLQKSWINAPAEYYTSQNTTLAKATEAEYSSN
jgi:hypothetical protein